MYTSSLCLIWSELDIRARIANARILDIEALAALFVPHPLDLCRPTLLLQLGQCAKENPDRMTAADRVLRPCKVFGEIAMSLRGFRGRESQQFHRLVVQSRNRLMDRVVGGRGWAAARETDSTHGTWWCLWIVERIRESCSPTCTILAFGDSTMMPHLPMTKIARDDAKCVVSRKERCDYFPEPNFSLTIYRADEDRDDGYIQPAGMVSLKQHA